MEHLQLSLSGLGIIAQRSGAELSQYLSKQIWTPQDRESLLSSLAQLLLDKECTLLVGRQLRPLLLDLLERNAEAIKAGSQVNHDLHERLCVAMSKLVTSHPDVLPFALQYFQTTSPVFQRLFLESCDASTVRYGRRRMKLRDLMEAAYRFLQQDKSYFKEMWDWSVCVPLLKSHDLAVRWYTAHCLALVTLMCDENKQAFLNKLFGTDELMHFKLQLLDDLHNHAIEQGLLLTNTEKSLWCKNKSQQYTQGQIVSSDLCLRVVPVCGILLPKQILKSKEQEIQKSPIVLVESTCRSLQSLAQVVSFGKAVLLEGPIGCGKTALVEHLATVTGRLKSPDIFKVQLGDQTDSKMLLGMYRCTDVPGEFVWQPGTLTQAVTHGHWILLEDIDYAPLDVISVLIPVLENGELLIPGRGDSIKVAPGFQLFATRRLLSSSSGAWYRPPNSHALLLDKYWTKIQLDNMSRSELKEVLQKLFPKLDLVVDRLLDIYIQLTGDKHQTLSILHTPNSCDTSFPEGPKIEDKKLNLEGRGLSLRDLLKWCNRIDYNFDGTSSSTALNIFHEALDCFTGMLSKPSSRLKIAEIIGSKLNISKQKAEFYCQLYKPEIAVRELDVSVGRVEMLRKQTDTIRVHKEKITFAATRPSSILIEQIAVCVNKGEPALLVGETGTGKTSTVQYLAHVAGQRLRIVNLNQQSDTADLLGGYKPVDHKLIWLPLREDFEELFTQTFSRKQNKTFLGHIQTCYRQKRWQDLMKLMQHIMRNAMTKVQDEESEYLLKRRWETFSLRLNQAQQQMRMTENTLLFAFVEGTLAQAVKKGEWILLDEINLAAAETLECLCGLLEGLSGSLVLLDRGDTDPLIRHPDFRLFACMNPATDVGKRNLPPGIRNRFTELYVEELENESDLQILIVDYLKGLNVNKSVVQGIISFYLTVRKKTIVELVDGTGHSPHYSLRTLCRALRYAALNPCINIQRSLYEGFCLSFLTQLDRASHSTVQGLICRHIVQSGNIKSLLKQPLPEPHGGRFVQIEGYWIPVGDKNPAIDESYILTPSVKLNLRDLVRVVSAGNHPVLLQGETSVGKTSLIRWLACASGNHCVRINNHEHTDIQEYIGCYTSDASGKLVFQEGVLIDAMRKGYWIILDELNLAPTDVLEALNRLLDDNRELFITETQEVVKAHPRFMLFATQNPPGIYGGRKVLSRAFRNRFVELHYDELPSADLETILHKRCNLPPSYCNKLVAVMLELQSLRRGSSVFAGKHGFITLRDLFRWAERYRLSPQTNHEYDWLQHLANDGFMLLAGRVRKQEEVDVILKVLKKCFKKDVVPQALFSAENVQKQLERLSVKTGVTDENFSHIVWTQAMRRLAVLVGRALEFGEPILLVGDTGCGKTTVCQLFAALSNQALFSVNCHQHMETSDFLGGLRPIRHRSKSKEDIENTKLFEWHDGPLVLAMREDGFFLLDEISLADDSVLERLNSVLEVEKTLVLAEKGSEEDDGDVEFLTAGTKFRILSTMNPGGDFGKKELSPALRNRFTEIWCPQSNDRQDILDIIKHNLNVRLFLDSTDSSDGGIAELIMDFIEWLINQEFGRRCILSIRDILSWVNFMNVTADDMSVKEDVGTTLNAVMAFIHAACLVYIDGIGSGTTFCSAEAAVSARQKCMRFLHDQLTSVMEISEDVLSELHMYEKSKERKISWLGESFGIHPFYIPRGPNFEGEDLGNYALDSQTTSMNAQRLLRALQLQKPILLEGSPGVGKTSLVAALAKVSGNHLVRINLSEQTDVTDLFGTDLPIEGGKGGEFAWRDGPFLSALKAGHWIVLDELNLASQPVLEGLNACFDHRSEVYIPELGMAFQVQHQKTKIFGCQNPFRQGGGRKGLPRSFLNRFTQVFVDQLSTCDMEFIANTLFPTLGEIVVSKMVAFNNQVALEVMTQRKWGQKGGPWEFNLRDLFRWCHLMLHDHSPGSYNPSQHVFLVYGERMRTKEDRQMVISVFKRVFGQDHVPYLGTRQFYLTPQIVQVGYSFLARCTEYPPASQTNLSLLHHSLQSLEGVMKCVEMNWMVILVGPAASGKTSLVQLLAFLTGNKLKVMAMNSAMDTTELLGGFEQADINRPWQQLLEKVGNAVTTLVRDGLLASDLSSDETEILLRSWSHLNLNHKPKTVAEGGRGITTELFNKLETVLLQIQRLNGKLNSFSKAEFTAILDHLHYFKDQLLNSVEGQSSGTFEWVDGMLVQALQSGDWLLMDNVNFCSSSVLDRLNALLEPGGVLTVSERGVIDGSTPTITPHPNFRLFFSMDPSHGEISRAMRNRGIEVFLSGDDGVVFDSFDIKNLLHGFGIIGDHICNALIAVHADIKETVVGSPCSSLSYLLHAAALISQQLQRGLGLEQAFQRSCSEVFIYSQRSLLAQKQVQEIIERHVSSLAPKDKSCLLSVGLWPDKVPSALFCTEDSQLSTILRDGQVLLYVLNRHSLQNNRTYPLALQDLEKIGQSYPSDSLNFDAVELEAQWMDDPVVIRQSVQLILEKSTSVDWMLRMRWLCHLAKVLPEEMDQIHTEIDAGAHALSKFYSSPLPKEMSSTLKLIQTFILDDTCIPFDLRWNMQLLDFVKHSLSHDPGMEPEKELFSMLDNVTNRGLVLLNRQRQSYIEIHSSKKLKRGSALKIAVDFHQDPAVHHDLPHPVVAHLVAFFDLWDMLVFECLQSNHTPLSNEATNEWRDRFRVVLRTIGLESADLALLTFHWQWLAKYSLKPITQLFLGHEHQRLSQEVQSVSESIQECLSSTQMPPSVKLLQKILGRPLPFKEASVVQCMDKLKALSNSLNVVDLRPAKGESSCQRDFYRLKAASSDWETKHKLLQEWTSILRANHQEDVNTERLSVSVEILRSHMKEQKIPLLSDEKGNEEQSYTPMDQKDLAQLSSEVQMWPSMEYLMLLWQYKLVTDLLSHSYYVRKNMQSDLNQLVSFCLKHTSLPSQHVRAFNFLTQHSEITSGDVALLWSELICCVFSSFWDSTVSTDPDYWLSWKPTSSPDGSTTQVLLEPSVKGPAILSRAVFSKCFCEVLLNSSKPVPWDLGWNLTSHVSLGEETEKTHQLQVINATLWTNMAVSSLASFRNTDSRLQGLLLYHHFVALKDLVPSTIQEEFLQYCDHLPSKDLSAYHYIQDILRDWSSQEKLPGNIIKLLLTSLQQFYADVDDSVRAAEASHRGSLWINLGLLQIHLWLPQTTFDPAIKKKYRLQYAEEELHHLEYEYKTRNLSSTLLTGKELIDEDLKKHIHPHISVLLQRIQKLKAVVHNLSKKQAYRPSSSSYDALYQDVQNYLNSIGKMTSIQDFTTRLQKALGGKGTKSRQGLNNLLSEEAAWQRSHHQFRKRLAEDYCHYPDMVTPLQAAILQVQHGVRIMASELFTTMNSTLISPSKITSLLTSLLTFPSTCDIFPTYFSRADSLCSVGSLDILKSLKKLSQKYPCKDQSTHAKDLSSCLTKEQLLINGLLYLRSHVLCKGEMDEQSLTLFRHINQAIINEWDEQEQRVRDREQEENSLFKYKTKSIGSGLSEDQEEENEFRLHYPTYEQDFADISAQPSLEESMATETSDETEDDILVSENSAQTLILTHQQLCLSSAKSLWYHQNSEQHYTKHYIKLFLSCYQTSGVLIDNLYPLTGSEVNDNLLGSHLLASTLLQNTISGNASSDIILQQDGPYDFYQHPNIQQARSCHLVLNHFIIEINKLLEQWPEHPALVQLVVIIDRIQGFPLSSPLSKFLNGLEMLLAKSQDWEENASSSLSLRRSLDEVTQLIIQCRKLELNCWSLSLDNAAHRHAKKSNKHWFSIYQMIEKYLESDKEQDKDREESTLQSITKTLQAFIESSSLGEFHSRLQMLLVFHCHVLLVLEEEKKDPLCSLLWNLFHYYKQFLPSIQARITELRNPVEKELKDFVKISKWNDVSFWSVKQSVEKTHRTLFKFTKKFEAALCQSSCLALIESVQEQQMDFNDTSTGSMIKGSSALRLRLASILKATLTGASSTPLSCGEDVYSSGSLQHRLPKLTKKMRKLCTTFIKKSQMPALFENLSDFIEGVTESVKELQNLKVNQTAEKEKQKSEAKNILLQKQRALSELFKMLAICGLSYRKGLSWIRTKNNQDILCLHPLDVNSALTISNAIKTSAELLAEITVTWDGCQKYFYRSLAGISRLETALVSPAKELGLGNIERCKGFSGHLLKVLVKQRSSLTAVTEQWIIFRKLLSSIQEIHSCLDTSNDYKIAFPPQDGMQQWLDRLQHLITQCSVVLKELSLFLECCPVKTSESEDGISKTTDLNMPSPATADWLPKLCTMRKSDNDWQQLNASVTKMLKEVKNSKEAVDKLRPQPGGAAFYSWTNFEACSAAVDTMQEVAVDLRDVELLFVLPETEVKEAAQHMIFLKSIHYLREEIRVAGREFSLWKSRLQAIGRAKRNQESDEKYVQDFSDQVEATIKKILYAIQTLEEKTTGKKMEEIIKKEEGAEENTVDSLQEVLITRLLTEDLYRDLKALDVQAVIFTVTELLERLKTYGEDCIKDKHLFFNQCCGLLVRLLPMVSTYSDLLLFYLNVSLATHRETGKLLSVLTQIFSALAQKGFCLPKELIEEAAGEGATEFHDYEGGGIGEGEGVKDVSNKIENEDQVEDVVQKGQEKEEDPNSKPDIKEEDDGIEMSEDFDGKVHEGDKEEQEEEEEDEKSDNEEELDKQMGDLGDAEADKLDERLWGDDDEEEENDDEEDKTEEQGQGMDTGESELVAKDDNQDAGNSDKDKDFKDEVKKEQVEDGQKDKIHEQIDEREYDDNEIDPYHGKQDTQQEPESLDLPDDLNLENDEGKVSGDEKDEENGEDGNPFDIDEKPMEIDEENKEQEDGEGNSEKEIQESEETREEQATDQDNEEQLQEEGPQKAEEEVEEAEGKEKIPDAAKDSENENELPTEQGLTPQNDEKSENELQDSTERMEHETYGKTAEDNLQSDDAAELAGAPSEKDEAKEEHGDGSADASQSEGHESKLMARLASQKQSVRNTQSIKRKPGQADDDRTLGDQNEQAHKRLRTMDTSSEMGNEDKQAQQNEEADAYEHIKQGAESYDAQTYDTASKDQGKSQPHNEEQDDSAVQDVEMESKEDETLEAVNVERLKPEEQRSNESIKQGSEETKLDLQGATVEDDVQNKDVEPTAVDKEKHERSTESTIHTVWEFLKEGSAMTPENPEELRRELEKQLEEWQMHPIGDAEEEKAAAEMWQRYLLLTGSLSQQLCEQLRLILEPTQAAKLKGDYRTGKRLNMRKVIPYIASQFRKDKIWLRRTKPSKRQYQICLAIDDSASMVDNHSKQLAYEALAVIGNALTLLEVGQIAVYSFGESVKLLHPFHEQFSELSGSRILSQCKFQQKKTLLAQFLESSVPMFEAAQRFSLGTNPETAQLLIIVSDGRGIFVEGKDRVTNAVQVARNANIFIIFIILDNPTSKDSILDIKVPIFSNPKEMPKMISYMEQFPFPFYIILRDVNSLPETLSDALRQWFELVTTSEHV
ncbi:LOW QUALITY PROTEIN: midasin [Rana temporaria]|uniref:LOW QUALITY PROTEIN: midasin n=1 Tax=Rana temporaria TaxID=8407 RepID=UPI001AAE149D|nr:LOW QUALITY PROTEIN: midasin [Rana temporaria]